MKNSKTEYSVINVFSQIGETERKKKINNAIRTLCVLDIEKKAQLHYNINVAFCGSVSEQKNGRDTLKC